MGMTLRALLSGVLGLGMSAVPVAVYAGPTDPRLGWNSGQPVISYRSGAQRLRDVLVTKTGNVIVVGNVGNKYIGFERRDSSGTYVTSFGGYYPPSCSNCDRWSFINSGGGYAAFFTGLDLGTGIQFSDWASESVLGDSDSAVFTVGTSEQVSTIGGASQSRWMTVSKVSVSTGGRDKFFAESLSYPGYRRVYDQENRFSYGTGLALVPDDFSELVAVGNLANFSATDSTFSCVFTRLNATTSAPTSTFGSSPGSGVHVESYAAFGANDVRCEDIVVSPSGYFAVAGTVWLASETMSRMFVAIHDATTGALIDFRTVAPSAFGGPPADSFGHALALRPNLNEDPLCSPNVADLVVVGHSDWNGLSTGIGGMVRVGYFSGPGLELALDPSRIAMVEEGRFEDVAVDANTAIAISGYFPAGYLTGQLGLLAYFADGLVLSGDPDFILQGGPPSIDYLAECGSGLYGLHGSDCSAVAIDSNGNTYWGGTTGASGVPTTDNFIVAGYDSQFDGSSCERRCGDWECSDECAVGDGEACHPTSCTYCRGCLSPNCK